MISIQRYGQLGNQLFQIAAAIGLSLKYDIPYCIPKHTLDDERWPPYHFENVNYCNDKEGVVTAEVYTEASFSYTEIPKPNHRNYILNGFFQSELYFKDYRSEILKAFGFDHLGLIQQSECTSIHIRRNDYLKLPTYHPVVTMDYITKAMKVSEEKGVTHFACFSDDMDWVMENINTEKFPDYSFEYIVGNSALADLKLMALCKNNITSNSTFSWWSAWINNNPDKTVIMPAVWFGASLEHDTKDLYLPNAIIL